MKNQTTLHNNADETIIRRDIHQQVTDTIITQLEQGTVPWKKPWTGDGNKILSLPKNSTTGNKYRGINILLLWGSAINNDFPTQEWATFKQWNEKKEAIRKGEKGSLLVYYDTIEKEVDGETKEIPFLKSSYVFNRSQLASYVPPVIDEHFIHEPIFDKIPPVEDFIFNTKAIIEHRRDGAAYIPSQDLIVMPHKQYFHATETCTATENYYSTLLHELTHWSGHSKRLDRKAGSYFGGEEYAFEELVAELGAAFLCAEFEITSGVKADHASYLGHWLKVLKENKYYIFKAAGEASKACNFLQHLQAAKPEVE